MIGERLRPLRVLNEILARTAEAAPDAVAVSDAGISHTYAELLAASEGLAASLQELGLARGDRVAIYMPNSWQCCVAIFAATMADGVLVIVNHQTPYAKLEYLLRDSGAKILIADASSLGTHLDELSGRDGLTVVLRSGSAREDAKHVVDFDTCAASGSKPTPARAIPLDLAALIYTSGSTGGSKGVMLNHQNMIFSLGSVSEYLGIGHDDRILNVLSLAYSYGLYQLFMATAAGATLVLDRSFSYLTTVVDRLEEQQITVFPGVPTLFAGLVRFCETSALCLPSVRTVTNAAAALPEVLVRPIKSIFPNADLYMMYGMTECKRISFLDPALATTKPGSVGKAMPGTEAFVADEDGNRLGPGMAGVLRVRGPHVMMGYWNQPELSAKVLKPGHYPGERVLVTGDYFRADEEGYLYFLGRSDDIIKSRGEKVSPTEIENVLLTIPGVRQAAVIGVPDEVLGEAVKAFLVLDEGVTLSQRDVRNACVDRVESFMVPRDVVFVPELPMTATGKVRKQDLRES